MKKYIIIVIIYSLKKYLKKSWMLFFMFAKLAAPGLACKKHSSVWMHLIQTIYHHFNTWALQRIFHHFFHDSARARITSPSISNILVADTSFFDKSILCRRGRPNHKRPGSILKHLVCRDHRIEMAF